MNPHMQDRDAYAPPLVVSLLALLVGLVYIAVTGAWTWVRRIGGGK
jgi:hypothetical protein